MKLGLRGGKRIERDALVHSSLARAGLSDMQNRHPATLSGGQRARVSLLGNLLSNPHALLPDGPFSRLDVELRATIREFTWAFAAQLSTLLVTHDIEDVPSHSVTLSLASQPLKSSIELIPEPRHAR